MAHKRKCTKDRKGKERKTPEREESKEEKMTSMWKHEIIYFLLLIYPRIHVKDNRVHTHTHTIASLCGNIFIVITAIVIATQPSLHYINKSYQFGRILFVRLRKVEQFCSINPHLGFELIQKHNL